MSDQVEKKGELEVETNMRRFELHREVDGTGVSGTGLVAEGIEFSSGKIALTFLSNLGSVNVLDNIKVLHRTSLHKGDTKIVWLDPAPFATDKELDQEETSDG